MKKIPTLFEREYENHEVVRVSRKVTPGCEGVLKGEGIATVKIDGSCCAVLGGVFYRRYDARRGKKPPEGAIPCQEADPVTGHWPHWVKVSNTAPEDYWHRMGYIHSLKNGDLPDGTYEIAGPHFRSNPYGLAEDVLIPHGREAVEVDRSYEGIREYLKTHAVEGLVFWKNGEPWCKIKRSDFGLKWPVTQKEIEESRNE